MQKQSRWQRHWLRRGAALMVSWVVILMANGLVFGLILPVFSGWLTGSEGWIPVVYAQSEEDKINDIQKEIEALSQKLNAIRQEKTTLASEIRYLDNSILLNEKEIEKTEYQITITKSQIADLTQRIQGLQASLGELSVALIDRIQTQYKRQATDPMSRLLATTGVADFFKENKYYEKVRAHTQELLITTEEKRQVYDDEKNSQQVKERQLLTLQQRLESQRANLAQQKIIKRKLLDETNNNERIYQERLNAARSELEAINSIIAGRGRETEVRDVEKGDRIATVIGGRSCNSGGTHLHFIVSQNGTTRNPFGYLKNVPYRNCSGAFCGSGDADPFTPSGDWDWPVDPEITLNQGYGYTWAVRHTWVGRIYSFHNGIDIDGSTGTVKAVAKGKLFRGAYTGSQGCSLQYVRVDHADSDLDTLYLHVNY